MALTSCSAVSDVPDDAEKVGKSICTRALEDLTGMNSENFKIEVDYIKRLDRYDVSYTSRKVLAEKELNFLCVAGSKGAYVSSLSRQDRDVGTGKWDWPISIIAENSHWTPSQ